MTMDNRRSIQSILASIRKLCDHNNTPFDSRDPVPLSTAKSLTKQYGDGIAPLLELLCVSDGVDIANLHICSSEEVFAYGHNMVAMQNWGNGDFDCLVLESSRPDALLGNIVFANHQPDVFVRVGTSVGDWLEKVGRELATRSEVLHPRDYINRTSDGVYSGVLDELRGHNCEIGRWLARLANDSAKKGDKS